MTTYASSSIFTGLIYWYEASFNCQLLSYLLKQQTGLIHYCRVSEQAELVLSVISQNLACGCTCLRWYHIGLTNLEKLLTLAHYLIK